jgi:UDP-N-acetylmuramoyl-tripeptide--D-alanyl-D-alanine ligase
MIKITPITTYEIADFLNVKRPRDNVLIKELSIDTREKFGESTCFIALDGENFSGVDFIGDAIEKGAKCVISNFKKVDDVSIICTFDTKKALLSLASREIKNTKIIAVTGSVGKTTVKEMISSILSQQYKVHSTYLNHNNEIGVAQTLFSLSNEDFCVVEMGMRGLGEIDRLASVCVPYIGVITNCGSAHIERLGSKENIFYAKCELIKYTTDFAIVPFEARFKKLDYSTLTPFFVGDGADVELGRVVKDKTGMTIDIMDNICDKILRIRVPSIFSCDATNALFAYKVAKICNVNDENIVKGFMDFKNCGSRGERIKIGNFEIVDDTYNASFESVEQGIKSLTEYCNIINKVSILVMGDMLEIGELTIEYHKKIGEIARKNGVDRLICFGEYSKFVCEGYQGGNCISSREEIADFVLKNAPDSSVILLKASRAMHFEKIIDDLKEKFNEN